MLSKQNYIQLLKNIEVESLLKKLIQQLNKDFQLANLNESFKNSSSIDELVSDLKIILENLIVNRYDDYLNLLYRIDVSEIELLKLKSDNLPEIIEQITYLVLKREYQKVWLKQHYDKK